LEEEDIREALSYAAWRVEETEVPLGKRSRGKVRMLPIGPG